jgi:hypothetical protein
LWRVDASINLTMAIYLSLRVIATLRSCSAQAVHKALHAGNYGPVLRHGGRVYAELAAIERRLGRRFTAAQITHASAGKPGSIVILDTPETEAA